MSQRSVKSRVESAAQEILADHKYVTPLDVVLRIGWLNPTHLADWQQGRAASLDAVLAVDDERLDELLAHLREWASGQGLDRGEDSYIARTRDRRALRFTAGGTEDAERLWRTRWTAPELPPKQAARIAERQSKAPEIVVVRPRDDFVCAKCEKESGGLLMMDTAGPLCMVCADLDHLVYLPAGDATLTRRAKKASSLTAVVVRWSKARKRYERQGLLVESGALAEAEASLPS